MPGFDRTGPQGLGPMTGGARGLCDPAGASAGYGRGYGAGRGMAYGRGFRGGFGRGFCRGFAPGRYPAAYAAPTYPADELSVLKTQAADMKGALDGINRRIAELEQAGGEE